MMCDMHYELDWQYRLRTKVECATAHDIDPCFATTACMCDTGFFRVVETMPTKPVELVYDGFTEVFTTYEDLERKKNRPDRAVDGVGAVEEDDKILGMELWQLVVAVGGLFIIIALIVIFCCRRKCRKARGTPTEHSSTLKRAKDVETGGAELAKGAAKDAEKGAKAGGVKKRKIRRRRASTQKDISGD